MATSDVVAPREPLAATASSSRTCRHEDEDSQLEECGEMVVADRRRVLLHLPTLIRRMLVSTQCIDSSTDSVCESGNVASDSTHPTLWTVVLLH